MNAPARTGNGGVALPHQPPARTGQATQIEQSRAATEVLAAVEAARRWPRDETTAQQAVSDVCQMTALANKAFFRLPRGQETVNGPSVHLARELARCWGNIQYGVSELRRDDEGGESEMQAYAWDLQTNSRHAVIFIVPHKKDAKRDGKKVQEPLADLQAVYENNANAGARRVRECIFAVIPFWLREMAIAACRKTLEEGGGKPMPQRRAEAIAAFEAIGVSQERLTAKIGTPSDRWTAHDLADLIVTYQSIQRGEVAKDQEFPVTAATLTSADLVGPAAPPAEQAAAERSANGKPSPKKLTAINAWFSTHKISRDAKLSYITALVEREVASTKELNHGEATALLTRLTKFSRDDDPVTALQEACAEYYDRQPADEADEPEGADDTEDGQS